MSDTLSNTHTHPSQSATQEAIVEFLDNPQSARKRTVWSFLSSAALHSSCVAVALLLITMLNVPPPRGVVDFETVAFTEDVAQKGGATADVTTVNQEQLQETEQLVESKQEALPESQVDVSESIDKAMGEVLTESESRVKEHESSVKASHKVSDAVVENQTRQQTKTAKALSAQIAALEKAARTRMSQSPVKLKRPGTDTDGRELFTVAGSNNVVFIIDTSGSMGAQLPLEDGGTIQALDFVKIHFSGLIRKQLTPSTKFNIIGFNSNAQPWRGKLVKATKTQKRNAASFLSGLQPSGGTNLYSALRLAFTDSTVQTIVVLSDGMPNVGGGPPDVLAACKVWNKNKEVQIHTIAFILPAGPRQFLKELAEQNNGRFHAFP